MDNNAKKVDNKVDGKTKKPNKISTTHIITVRVKPEVLEIIDKKADLAQVNRSDFIRNSVENVVIARKNNDRDLPKLIEQIKRIGNNFNQISLKINKSGLTGDNLNDFTNELQFLNYQLNAIYKEVLSDY